MELCIKEGVWIAKLEKKSNDLKIKQASLNSAILELQNNRVEQLEKYYPNIIHTQSLVLVLKSKKRMKKTRRKEEPSSIAWGWVMETLADLKQVDTPLVDDLLSKVPCGSDSLPSGAKERLALRRLDELFASTPNSSLRRCSPASDSVVIDVSKSAQDVYSHLASIQKDASSSRTSMLDSFKFEAHKFTLQKRASLPKCVIQQLEEVLTEGNQPYISVLRGTSEEVVQKLDQIRNGIIAQTPELNSTRSVPDNQGNHLQDNTSGRPSGSTRKKVHFADESPTVHYADDVVNDTEVRTEFGEVEIATSSVPEYQTEDLRDGHLNDVVGSYKRTRSKVVDKQHAHSNEVGEVQIATSSVPEYQTEDLRDGHLNDVVGSQKRTRSEVVDKQHAHSNDRIRVKPAEHISDPTIVSERSECLNENTLSYDQNGATNSANGNLVQDLPVNINLADVDVGVGGERVAKRMKVSYNATDYHQPGFISSSDNTHHEAVQSRLCSNNNQTDLEAPLSNVENSGQGNQGQDLQEDVGCGVNDIDKGTQAQQAPLEDGLCGHHCQTELEALRGSATDYHQLGFISSDDNTHQEAPQGRLCINNSQSDLESPQSNVENSGQGKQGQDPQEDVGCWVNDIGKETQAQQEALQDGLCGRLCQTEPEALRGNAETSGKGTQVQNLQEDDVLVDDDDVDCELLLKRLKVGAILTVQDQPETIGSSDRTRQKAPLDGPQGNSYQTEPESSQGNVEHPDRVTLVSNTNMTGAQSTLNQDSFGKDWLEKETCAKCNGDDKLLFCSGSACYVAVHERCLGLPASFDNAGNFYCPYCTYSRANLACHELAKKLSEAKKIAHLAKIQFNRFMQAYKREESYDMPSGQYR